MVWIQKQRTMMVVLELRQSKNWEPLLVYLPHLDCFQKIIYAAEKTVHHSTDAENQCYYALVYSDLADVHWTVEDDDD
jgi:hypothetical protein